MYVRLVCIAALLLGMIGCSDSQPSEHRGTGSESGRSKTSGTLSIPACEDVPRFTDITVDPVVPGGMTEREIRDSVAVGWVDGETAVPRNNCLVMFRNSVSGELEWRCGTIPAGTRILKSPNGDIGLAAHCRNTTDLETLQDSWFPR